MLQLRERSKSEELYCLIAFQKNKILVCEVKNCGDFEVVQISLLRDAPCHGRLIGGKGSDSEFREDFGEGKCRGSRTICHCNAFNIPTYSTGTHSNDRRSEILHICFLLFFLSPLSIEQMSRVSH